MPNCSFTDIYYDLLEAEKEIDDIRNDLKNLSNEMKNENFMKIVGPFPAPKQKKVTVLSIEDKEKRLLEKEKQDLLNQPEDFSKTFCELMKLQKEFIETQIKYKAFPK